MSKVPQERMPDDIAAEIAEWLQRIRANPKLKATKEFMDWAVEHHRVILDSPQYEDHINELTKQDKPGS